MNETLNNISGVAGAITTIFGCCVLFVKPIRNCVVKAIRKRIKDDQQDNLILEIRNALNEQIKQDQARQVVYELHTEALLGLLRSNITHSYNKYRNLDGIPNLERENVIKQYTIYHKMNGNSYVDVIYNELLEFPVLN